MYRGPGPGFHDVFGILGAIVYGLFFVLCLVVAVGLIVLLVRFLLVATRAAQLYVEKNGPAKPAAPGVPPAPPASPAETAPSSVATPAAPSAPAGPAAPVTTAITKPTTKRTPKAPPAV